ncbi:MAG TPA: hypothetical protein VNS63_26110 [Blastocatellia bacterium]|nr:hypothetical protein [Blastocatellia bacterium]
MNHNRVVILFGCAAIAAAVASLGCGTSSVSNSNVIAGRDPKISNSSAAPGSSSASPNVLEPDRYFVNMTASLESKSAPPQPLSFSFAKLGADRRWSFQLTQAPISYIEKSGLKYLVVPALGQYAEIMPGEAGFQPSELMTPNFAWARLKSRPADNLGAEPVNGRTAIKYSYRNASEAADRSEFLLVDQETGLAIRSELNPIREREVGGSRLIVDARDLQLNPDSRQFDVPSGMKKVTAEQLKPQIRSLVEALRVYSLFY